MFPRSLLRHWVSHPPVQWRFLSTTLARPSNAVPPPKPVEQTGVSTYKGPLTTTFRRLKILSLSSFALTTTISPFFFIIESNLPTVARISLAGIAVTTSAVSTAMVGYFTRPYVTSMRQIKTLSGSDELEFTTHDILLRPNMTRVYDTDFLADTQRPFAKWYLPTHVLLPASRRVPQSGTEETVAETFNAKGDLLGSWVVKWGENGEGNCQALGKVVRHFNIHLEFLNDGGKTRT